MPKINDIFKHTKGLKGLVSKTEEYLCLKKHWKTIFGSLHHQFNLEFLRDQKLIISTQNYNWVTEIEDLKSVIIQKANEVLKKKKAIKDIKIIVEQIQKKSEPKHNKLKSLELKDLIQEENQQKRKKGYQLCLKCKNILTKQAFCVSCNSSLV